MTNEHLYVYCAVRGRVPARSVAKLPALPGGSPPRVVPLSNGISLVVADVPAETYRGEAIEARLGDLDWVARCGASHHAVADQLSARHTVAPFRLFTLFSSEARAVAALGRRARRIDEALDRIKGRAEWVLRISKPDVSRAAESRRSVSGGGAPGPPSRDDRRTAAERRPKTAADTATPGTSFLAGKAAAKRAAAESAARVREDASAVFEALERVADQSDRRSIEPSTGLLLDAAFLVPARQTAAFKRALTRTAAGLLREGCRVSLTGPWPPYSFVALETARG